MRRFDEYCAVSEKYGTPKQNAKAEIYQDRAYINNAPQTFYLFLIHNKLLFLFSNAQKVLNNDEEKVLTN